MSSAKQPLRCDKCRWWYKTTGGNGRCHFTSPIKDKTWPMTYMDDWCGQFTPDIDCSQDLINAIRTSNGITWDSGPTLVDNDIFDNRR